MLFLAIETSSAQGSLALFRDRDMLREVLFEKGLTCVRDIAEHIRGALQSEGLTVRSLRGIAVSVGPGSYTGVRVGVTAAKTLGFALEVPVVGVESLRVLAANLVLMGPSAGPERALVAPILDGKQRFLYGSLYEVAAGSALPDAVRELLPQSVDLADELCRTVGQKVEEERAGLPTLVIGDGAAAFLEIAGTLGLGVPFEPGPDGLGTPRARAVGLLAEPELTRARWDREAVHRLEPLYLRVTEAERRLMEARQK
jgi:tRNA threonylcarbamoyladenosine biosynthesis protein TsaB